MEVNDPVSTVMSRSVVVATASHKFSEVLELFSKHGMHHLPVVDDSNHLIGIISSNDVMKIFGNPAYRDLRINTFEIDKVKIADLMTPDPLTVTSKDTLKKAIKIFADKKFMSLPVVDNGEITGILSVKDIVHLLAYFN